MKPYPEYKASGLDWLPQVPAHWEVKKGRHIFRRVVRPVRPEDEVVTAFRDGQVTLRKNRRTEGFTESITETGYQGIRKNDLVIHAMDAFAGAIGVSDSDGKSTPVYSACVPVADADPFYFAELLRVVSRTGYLQALARGIRERSTDFRYEQFAALQFILPPLAEQRQIVAYLAAKGRDIETYIGAKRAIVARLAELSTALIARAVTRGLDATAPTKPSGVAWLGDVPAHWENLPIKYCLRGFVDTEHKTAPTYDGGKYLVVRTSNVRNGALVLENALYTDEQGYREWTRRAVPEPGDIMFTREAPAGEACIVPRDLPLCLGQRMVLLQVNHDRLNEKFCLYSIYGGAAREFIKILSQGTTVPHFNMSDIGSIPLVLPPLTEQAAIVAHIETELALIAEARRRAEREIELARELWTTLVAEAVTGRVDVRGADTVPVTVP